MYLVVLLLSLNILSVKAQTRLEDHVGQLNEENSFKLLIEEIMIRSLRTESCVCVMTDEVNRGILVKDWFRRFGWFISFIMISVEENEDLLSPNYVTKNSLMLAKDEDCQLYIILLSNGMQVSRLLQFGDKYRVLSTRSKYILLSDNRLFETHLFYLWRRIINVVFIKEYLGRTKEKKRSTWYEITTVPFPSPITTIFLPRRLDIWTQNKFRKGVDLFRDKTTDLKNQTLQIAAFGHLPGTVKNEKINKDSVRAVIGENTTKFSGAEVEILKTVSNAMNFRCKIYEPPDADTELWGKKQIGGKYTGIIGEMINSYADIALGDLYYTPYLLQLMDLSVPYNTECLTFLTPESLSDNSWKTLILPFKPLMWAAVIICLIISGIVFHVLARFHEYLTVLENENKEQENPLFIKKKKILTLGMCANDKKIDTNTKYMIMREQYTLPTVEGQAMGLYQFSQPFNSMLYTYSMLLLVSLPKLPTGWSLRMLTGWYWLYCLLLAVAYRASMTAILANPQPRVTIDTVRELVDSRLTFGGWGEINREFFKSVLDPSTREIGENFEIVNNASDAVDRVAEASFAFYENTYFLKEAIVKRQLRFQQNLKNFTSNSTQEARDIARADRNLHIMSDCIINMPISIGLQKNSPIKLRMNKIIRKVLEAGLVTKWLDDVMQKVLNSDVQEDSEATKALMSMKKFFGALVALFIGYFISISALIVEIVYFRFVVIKSPNYNKYSKIVKEIKKAD